MIEPLLEHCDLGGGRAHGGEASCGAAEAEIGVAISAGY